MRKISGPLTQVATGLSATYLGDREAACGSRTGALPPGRHARPQFPPAVIAVGVLRGAQGGVAVVQTLHNYRLICPSAQPFRNGSVCEQCPGKLCSNIQCASRLLSRQPGGKLRRSPRCLCSHRTLGTWKTMVDAYIASPNLVG